MLSWKTIIALCGFLALLGLLALGFIFYKTRPPVFVLNEVTVTIPEGFNIDQIGDSLERAGLFSKNNFLGQAKYEEGFLFPDTYRFYKNSTPTAIISKMRENFDEKITPDILTETLRQNKTLKDVVVMASILEGETKNNDDRKMVSGILWKRLQNNIALQVDVAPETYKSRGLPGVPISNPGLSAILSALYPKNSPYLFYLYGKDGQIHYAKTFEEHKLNKYRYLR